MAVNSTLEYISFTSLSTYYAILLSIIALITYLLYRHLSPPTHPPSNIPVIQPRIPLIGHILGITLHKTEYLNHLALQHPHLLIFRLPLLPFVLPVIIVTSLSLAQSSLRNRALSFDPFGVAFTKRVLLAKGEWFAHLCKLPTAADPNPSGKPSGRHYVGDLDRGFHGTFSPFPAGAGKEKGYARMRGRMLAEVEGLVNSIGRGDDGKGGEGKRERVELYGWVRDGVTVVMNYTLFGDRGPVVKESGLIEDFWTFEAQAGLLMADFLPYLTARKAALARDRLMVAFRAYIAAKYENGDDVSDFIKEVNRVQREWGVSDHLRGNYGLSMLLVGTTNAAPTMFWGVTYVYSDLSLLSELRDEINDLACDFLSSSEGSKGVIHVSKLETACPLLASACEEVIRMSNRQVSIRSAVDDAVISSEEGSYAIKKDTVVFIPTPSHHTDPRVWGPDAESFNPRRFMRSGEAEKNSAQINEQKKLQKKAFFPFGGGKHMCPGRFFAHTELMTFVAVLVMGFDIVMADGLNEGSGGPLKVPERYYRYFAEGTPKPKEKLDVCIKRRNGFDDVVWVLDAEDDGTAT